MTARPPGDPYAAGHFEAGRPFVPSARFFRAVQQQGRVVRAQTGPRHSAQPPGPHPKQWPGCVTVRNDSGGDRGQFDVLGIDGPIADPSTSEAHERTFAGRVALRGVTPGSEHYGRFVVLQEPIKDGHLGRAQIDGPCPCLITPADDAKQYAEIVPGEYRLKATDTGHAEILWQAETEEGAESIWAVLRLGRRPEAAAFGELLEDLHVLGAATFQVWQFTWDHQVVQTGRIETCYDGGFIASGHYLPADGRLVSCDAINAGAPHWMVKGASECQEEIPDES